jgi:hypothetical protein
VPRPVLLHRSVGVWLVAVLGAALALSACSSPSPPGVLAQADIPSFLGVKLNPPEAPMDARVVLSAPCHKPASAVAAVFKSRKSLSPTVTSIAVSCPGISQAQKFFDTRKVGARGYPLPEVKGHSLTGIGDEAWFIDQGGKADLRDYTVVWRQVNRVSSVSVEGPRSDKRITPALAELLARRAAARS